MTEQPRNDPGHNGVIMIVDDHPANLGFLFDYLERSGFKVLVAMDGEEALSQLQHARPDLILLDIMMPGIDGFQTCSIIKSTPGTEDIPVIFMSARTDTQDKVKGFQVGAVDYVDKPVHKEEVLARVNAHIALKRLQSELKAQNTLLEQRNDELDAFSHMVAHDLRNALHRVLNYAEILLEQPASAWPAQDVKDLEKIRDSALRMQNIIESMLMLARMSRSQVELSPLRMDEIIGRVLLDLDTLISRHRAVISVQSDWPVALGYTPWVERVWFNYISNGLKYGGDPPRLALGGHQEESGAVCFWIRDSGPGLSDEAIANVFKPFVQGQNSKEGFGIGLAIVHRIIRRLGGTIGARNLEGGGCEFSFTLPGAP